MRHCPVCKKEIQGNAAFCCDRCRQIDLGKWLNEDYRLPATDQETDSSTGENE
ncbi:MAG: DNA gyrase inhibitor YacG [Polyangiaceae bacterium]